MPTVPVAVVALEITGAATAIVKERVAVPVPAALVALRLTEELPDAVGVPEIKPLVVLIDNPAGRPVAP